MPLQIGSSQSITQMGSATITGSRVVARDGPLYSEGFITKNLGRAASVEITFLSGLGIYVGLTRGGKTPVDVEHGLHVNLEGNLYAVSGNDLTYLRTYQFGSVLSVIHDGISVSLLVDGVRVHSQVGRIGEWSAIVLINGTGDGFRSESLAFSAPKGIYNGDAETGDLSGWRNSSEDNTASGALSVVSEACSGDFCFAMARQGPGICSMTSRAFPVSSLDIYSGFFNIRGDTESGSLSYYLLSGNSTDDEGFLSGDITRTEVFTFPLREQWHNASGTVSTPIGRRFGAVEVRSSALSASRYLMDNISFERAFPFAPSGIGSPETCATNSVNMIINSEFDESGDGLLGVTLPEGVTRLRSNVDDKGRYHLAADSLSRVYLNYSDERLFGLNDRPLTCGAFVFGAAVSFHIECYDNEGTQIGQDEVVLTPSSSWSWRGGSLQPPGNTVSAKISLLMSKNAKVVSPMLMQRMVGSLDLVGEDALRFNDNSDTSPFSFGAAAGSLLIKSFDEVVAKFSGNSTEIINGISTPSVGAKTDLNLSAPRSIAISSPVIALLSNDMAVLNINQGGISFSTTMGQMINLDSPQYGIGVQAATTYLRTSDSFAIHRGGTHVDASLDSGGGQTLFDVSPVDIHYLGRSIAPRVLLNGFSPGGIQPSTTLLSVIAPHDFDLSLVRSRVYSSQTCLRDTNLAISVSGLPYGFIVFRTGGNMGEIIITDNVTISNQSHIIVRSPLDPDPQLSDITFLLSE